MMRNVLLKIQYDGTNFHGWQRQPEVRTVQGELERVLSKLCACPVQLDGTSRTDAGVHALGQQASFKGDFAIPADKLKFAANNMLAGGMNKLTVGDIKILEASDVPIDFHARFSSKGKKYIYKISNTRDVDIFRRNYTYNVADELDIEAMRKAAGILVGEHDFKSFEAAGGTPRLTTVRTIYALDINARAGSHGRELEIHISGNGFLYNMVRIITGTLVDIGKGRIAPDDMQDILESCDRTRAGHTAPPQGLYLAEVYY